MNHKEHHPHQSTNQPPEVLWGTAVMRKWLNRTSKKYSADPEEEEEDDGCDTTIQYVGEEESCDWPNESRYKQGVDFQSDPNGAFPRLRRRKSETCRAQYIDAKELKISVSTWNVGGKLPPEDLDIEDLLDVNNPADIYVIGFQEIIPLNAGNIFGAEDNRPVPKWETVIRRTLNKVRPENSKFKCYSNPSSPSRFTPSDDAPDIEDEVMLESDSEGEEEFHPYVESNFNNLTDCPAGLNGSLSTLSCMQDGGDLEKRFSAQKTLDKVKSFTIQEPEENVKVSTLINSRKLTRIVSGTERIGLCWPEPPLDLLAQCVSETPNLLKSVNSFKASKSFRTFASFKSHISSDTRVIPEEAFLAELDLDSTMYRKRRSPYVRIVSKQMVGIFITIWVHRRLRKHIQNVHVSAVGVGVMGYIGNKVCFFLCVISKVDCHSAILPEGIAYIANTIYEHFYFG